MEACVVDMPVKTCPKKHDWGASPWAHSQSKVAPAKRDAKPISAFRFLGASQQADRTMLIMEYMYRGDMYSQIKHDSWGHLRWHNKGWSIALDIVKGLTYLHSHQVPRSPAIWLKTTCMSQSLAYACAFLHPQLRQ